MRPSDHEFETEFGGGLEAWHPDCAGLAWARLYAEAQRARAAEVEARAECLRWSERWEAHITGAFRAMEERAEAAEAKLREAEQSHAIDMERYANQADECIRAEIQRAVKAASERDEARAEVVALKRRLEWASKDAHTLHGPLTHVGPWEDCDADSCTEDRAALGEKP